MSLMGYLLPSDQREYVKEQDREKSFEERLRFLAEQVKPLRLDRESCDAVLRAHCQL